ncbi:Glu/Leu/Phe/Val dehydrogenase [Vampirovibrio sp.]|uniref:Glu/Leu/Phe/Val family dehydrogenase n=1 Tax=Vampirovibrio sp. TaxID=2717857 RepID=UPI003594189A
MSYFEMLNHHGHEGVFFCADPESGLRGMIAIHDTTLGPALGGCRMKAYACEADALSDVLRLSRAMTYKSAVAGLNLGGGKSVVILERPEQKTPALLKAFAERINLLKGHYIGAGDVGSDTHDLRLMRQVSPFITGLAKADGGLGDSSILTALGVFQGIQAAVLEKLGRHDLDGLKIAVQGAGKVGFHLVEHLLNAGCRVYISDPDLKALANAREHYPGLLTCDGQALFEQEVDVFSPNAIGGVITNDIAHGLKAKIVAGGANNPLSGQKAAQILHERGILYAPDFVINAGGVIMVACEIEQLPFAAAREKTLGIYETTRRVFELSRKAHLLPWNAAQRLALNRIEEAQSREYHYGRGQHLERAALV